MSSTTKKDLSEAIFDKVGLSKKESKKVVEVFFEEITRDLERGNLVLISNFGSFNIRDKKARPGRNPRTSELVPIAPRRTVVFHASLGLKKVVGDSIRDV